MPHNDNTAVVMQQLLLVNNPNICTRSIQKVRRMKQDTVNFIDTVSKVSTIEHHNIAQVIIGLQLFM